MEFNNAKGATAPDSPTTQAGNQHEAMMAAIKPLLEDMGPPIRTKSFVTALKERNYNTALRRACTSTQPPDKVVALVTKALEFLPSFQGFGINSTSEKEGPYQGYSALHHAARKGNQALYNLLVSNGANPDLAAKDKATPAALLAAALAQQHSAPETEEISVQFTDIHTGATVQPEGFAAESIAANFASLAVRAIDEVNYSRNNGESPEQQVSAANLSLSSDLFKLKSDVLRTAIERALTNHGVTTTKNPDMFIRGLTSAAQSIGLKLTITTEPSVQESPAC